MPSEGFVAEGLDSRVTLRLEQRKNGTRSTRLGRQSERPIVRRSLAHFHSGDCPGGLMVRLFAVQEHTKAVPNSADWNSIMTADKEQSTVLYSVRTTE